MKKVNSPIRKESTLTNPTYISLFSSAGVGCHGFKLEGFKCLATVEIIERRLKIQEFNNKCNFREAYIADDIKKESVQNQIKENINKSGKDLDVLIATPPCQGMSVANHKKNNELERNSLVVESIKLTKEISPKFFIFENVRSFLKTTCTDLDKKNKTIKEAIEANLENIYNIHYTVINFKNYGSNSSRTRTLVLGVRKDVKHITPLDLMPDWREETKLWDVIGDLKSLKKMGEIDPNDIYHQFKRYNPIMLDWIKDIKEGQSAFENKDKNKIPHRIVDGKIIYNKSGNSDKYKRLISNKVAACIHTRNDILASQNTVHPKDNRVLSIRELMRLMTIPDNFKWTDLEFTYLNKLSYEEKELFLKKNEINIRQSIGEAVPTEIFRQIAKRIDTFISKKTLKDSDILKLIEEKKLFEINNLKEFLNKNLQKYEYAELFRISELSNTKRNENSAYYTPQNIVYSLIKELPELNKKKINILEPSVGIGSFLPSIIKKYSNTNKIVNIDVLDIDKDSLCILKILLKKIKIPKNININYINDDFLTHNFDRKYDIVIGNPPFGKVTKSKDKLTQYKKGVYNQDTNNIFSFFLEKSLSVGDFISLIIPKSLLNTPEFNKTRLLISKHNIKTIIDYGEKGFDGVKIETISLMIDTKNKYNHKNIVKIESYITNNIEYKLQKYITNDKYPYWLIYRNNFFDEVSKKIIFDIFEVYRDRQITKKYLKKNGKIRVLKSRNISSNKIIDIEGYDSYLDDIGKFNISKFLNKNKIVLIPNLTYNPRACFLPKNAITDGSVAMLKLKKDTKINITKKDLEYFSSNEFKMFYKIARNMGTRSLNIDKNSVFFFGKLK